MHVPIGVSGVQAVPNTRHSHGLMRPVNTDPHSQATGSGMSAPGTVKRFSASHRAYSSEMPRPESSSHPRPRHSKRSRTVNTRSSNASAAGFPSVRTTRAYWLPTAALPPATSPETNCSTSIATACRMSSGSKPATTHGMPNSSGRKSKAFVPTTVATWPGPMNPSTSVSPPSTIARSGGSMVTWLEKTEKFGTPLRRAASSVTAVDGAVVSNPTAKNTTCLSGLSSAIFSASSGEYTKRTSAPFARASRSEPSEPGTRIMSPKVVRMTSGWAASHSASSTRPMGITHTGQPGPWTSSMFSGSRFSSP